MRWDRKKDYLAGPYPSVRFLHKPRVYIFELPIPTASCIIIIIIIIIIALQHSEDLDRVNEEQKLVLNEDES